MHENLILKLAWSRRYRCSLWLVTVLPSLTRVSTDYGIQVGYRRKWCWRDEYSNLLVYYMCTNLICYSLIGLGKYFTVGCIRWESPVVCDLSTGLFLWFVSVSSPLYQSTQLCGKVWGYWSGVLEGVYSRPRSYRQARQVFFFFSSKDFSISKCSREWWSTPGPVGHVFQTKLDRNINSPYLTEDNFTVHPYNENSGDQDIYFIRVYHISLSLFSLRFWTNEGINGSSSTFV